MSLIIYNRTPVRLYVTVVRDATKSHILSVTAALTRVAAEKTPGEHRLTTKPLEFPKFWGKNNLKVYARNLRILYSVYEDNAGSCILTFTELLN